MSYALDADVHYLRKRAVFSFPRPVKDKDSKAPKYDKHKPLSVFYHADERLLEKAAKYSKITVNGKSINYEKARQSELKVRVAQREVLSAIYSVMLEVNCWESRSYRSTLPIQEQALLAGCYCESVLFQAEVIAQGFRLHFLTDEMYHKLRTPALQLCASFQTLRLSLRNCATKAAKDTARSSGVSEQADQGQFSKLSRSKKSFLGIFRRSMSTPNSIDAPSVPNSAQRAPVTTQVDNFSATEESNSRNLLAPQRERPRANSTGATGPSIDDSTLTNVVGSHRRRNSLVSGSGTVEVDRAGYFEILGILKEFDIAWTTFEKRLLACTAVNGRSVKFEEQKQLLTVMMSEAVEEALSKKYLNREMLEEYDPSVVFALPRLALLRAVRSPQGTIWDEVFANKSNYSFFKPIQNDLEKMRSTVSDISEDDIVKLEKLLWDSNGSQESVDIHGAVHEMYITLSRMSDHLHTGNHAKDIVEVLNSVFVMHKERSYMSSSTHISYCTSHESIAGSSNSLHPFSSMSVALSNPTVNAESSSNISQSSSEGSNCSPLAPARNSKDRSSTRYPSDENQSASISRQLQNLATSESSSPTANAKHNTPEIVISTPASTH
eukprot:Nk52_evm33s1073 gene=Nk52_evmTU33s1073